MKSALARKDFDEAVAYHDEEVNLSAAARGAQAASTKRSATGFSM